MYLGDCLDATVRDENGTHLGYVLDVRLALDEAPLGPPGSLAAARICAVVVCPRRAGSFLGYERTSVTAPAVIARMLRWWYHGTYLVLWDDIRTLPDPEQAADPDRENLIIVRAGSPRYDPALPRTPHS